MELLPVIRQGQGLLALHGLAVVDDVEGGGGRESVHDGAERLEVAHALEAVDHADGDRVVGRSADLAEEKAVCSEIGVGEIELDLRCMGQ